MKKFILLMLMAVSLIASALEIAKRPGKATGEILIFPQLEAHYGTFQNFLHYWKDRPLYVDPAHRYEGNQFTFTTEPSVMKQIELAKSYNVAGLSPLGGMSTSQGLFDAAEKNDVKDFRILPAVYLPGITYASAAKPAELYKVLRRAIASNKVFRINGKVVINSYEAASKDRTPARMKEILDQARKEVGDGFLFVADVKIPLSNYYRRHYDANRKNPDPAAAKKLQDDLQAYLDVTDGLYIGFTGRRSSYEEGGEYGTYVDEEFADHIRPVILELFARPQNKGKILGVITTLGYINHFTGMVNAQEYGSETFRKSFESALKYDPDFIVPFEWNEWNENTCFEPSVYKGSGYRRIIRYYQSLFDGKKLQPLPGDDLSVPNMLLSYRYAYKLGDVMRFEMLNVPDGGKYGDYKAQITLKDANGEVVHTLPQVTVSGSEFKAVTQTLPSEMFAAHQLLVPELKVTDAAGNERIYAGNLYIRFTPAHNTIYQYVRVALREAAEVKSLDVTISLNPDGSYRVRGKIVAAEPLASVELLDNRTEMRALGEDAPEFDQNKYVVIQLTTNAVPGPRVSGEVKVENVSKCIARSAKQDGKHENFHFDITQFGIKYRHAAFGSGNRRVFFAIPRAEADKAVITGDLDLFKFAIPVKDIMKYGVAAREFEPCIYFRFDRLECQPDIPVRLNKKEVSFDCNVFSDAEFPVFHLRLIGEDGKLFRTAPVQMEFASGKPVELPVWSETERKIVKLQVASDRIPDIKYIFDPAPGAILLNSANHRFDGEIGSGYRYCQPYRSPKKSLPSGIKTATAKWVTDETGAPALRFDGKASNISFYPEVFPLGAFTFECEFKPAVVDDMVIFRHSSTNPGSLGVFIQKGKLLLNFMVPSTRFKNLHTKMWVKVGEWNKLKITSDIKTLTVELNGQKQSFSNIGVGGAFRGASFGGPIKNYGTPKGMKMFQGDLKSLRIYHNCK